MNTFDGSAERNCCSYALMDDLLTIQQRLQGTIATIARLEPTLVAEPDEVLIGSLNSLIQRKQDLEAAAGLGGAKVYVGDPDSPDCYPNGQILHSCGESETL